MDQRRTAAGSGSDGSSLTVGAAPRPTRTHGGPITLFLRVSKTNTVWLFCFVLIRVFFANMATFPLARWEKGAAEQSHQWEALPNGTMSESLLGLVPMVVCAMLMLR